MSSVGKIRHPFAAIGVVIRFVQEGAELLLSRR
jgi:hypothetical protein